jgi:hypothetical protein
VLQKLGRRALDLVVGLFAVLGFIYVPLGARTGFEHVKAILGTPPAVEAYRGFSSAFDKLRRAILDRATRTESRRKTEAPSRDGLVHAAPVDAGADASLTAPGG